MLNPGSPFIHRSERRVAATDAMSFALCTTGIARVAASGIPTFPFEELSQYTRTRNLRSGRHDMKPVLNTAHWKGSLSKVTGSFK